MITPQGSTAATVVTVHDQGLQGTPGTTYPPAALTPNILTQTDIYWRPQTGNDAADGLTSGTAIRTYREYWRRLLYASTPFPVMFVGVTQTLHQLESQLDDSDPVYGDILRGTNGGWIWLGGFDGAPSRTSTFTAWTARNPMGAANDNQGTDSTLAAADSWNTYASQLVRVPRTGALAWVVTSLGAKKGELTRFTSPFATGQATLAAPAYVDDQAPGDTYEVRNLIRACWGGLRVRGLCVDANNAIPGATTANVYMKQLQLTLPTSGMVGDQAIIQSDRACGFVAIECRFDMALWCMHGVFTFVNCFETFTEALAGAEVTVYVGGCNTSFGGWEAQQAGQIIFYDGHVIDGFNAGINSTRGGQVTCAGVGLQGSSSVQLQEGGKVAVSGNSGSLYGATNGDPAGVGELFTIAGFCAVMAAAPTGLASAVNCPNTPTLWTFCGRTTSFPFDPTASPPGYASARTNTLAHFVASVAAGGFNGNAHDPASGSFIGQWL